LHPGIFDRVSKMAGHDGLSKDQACEVA